MLHNKTFSKTLTILLESIKNVNDEMIRKSSLVILIDWNFEHFKGFGIRKTEKGLEIMTSEKNMRMEEIGNGQQEMQEKIAQMMKNGGELDKREKDY